MDMCRFTVCRLSQPVILDENCCIISIGFWFNNALQIALEYYQINETIFIIPII